MERLVYERINNSENVIKIDLHNGYSVIAISGWQVHSKSYLTTMFLKDNTIDTLKLIEEAESVEFHATYKTINSAILKWVGTHFENGTLQKYIDRYHYEMTCFDMGNDVIEKVRLANVS